jgi:DNA replication protein DnaC
MSTRRTRARGAGSRATLADAICDRILHNVHRIVLKGPSRRKEAKLDD